MIMQPARIVALRRSAFNGRFHARLQPTSSTIRCFRNFPELAPPVPPLVRDRSTAVINFTNFMDGIVAWLADVW